MENEKLYVVVRKDLSPGAMLAQSCHAALMFGFRHPEHATEWFWDSNNIVILECADESSLRQLALGARQAKIPYALFCEPDFAMQATAAAFGSGARRMLSSLPLAGRPRKEQSAAVSAPA